MVPATLALFVAVLVLSSAAPAQMDPNEAEVTGEFLVLKDGYQLKASRKLAPGTTGEFKFDGKELSLTASGTTASGMDLASGLAFRAKDGVCFFASLSDGVDVELVELQGIGEIQGQSVAATYNAKAAAKFGVKPEICMKWVNNRSFVVRAGSPGMQRMLVRPKAAGVSVPRLLLDMKLNPEIELGVEDDASVSIAFTLPQSPDERTLLEAYCIDQDLDPPEGDMAFSGSADKHLAQLMQKTMDVEDPDILLDRIWETEQNHLAKGLTPDDALYLHMQRLTPEDGESGFMGVAEFPEAIQVTYFSPEVAPEPDSMLAFVFGNYLMLDNGGVLLSENQLALESIKTVSPAFFEDLRAKMKDHAAGVFICQPAFSERYGGKTKGNSFLEAALWNLTTDVELADQLPEELPESGWLYVGLAVDVEVMAAE